MLKFLACSLRIKDQGVGEEPLVLFGTFKKAANCFGPNLSLSKLFKYMFSFSLFLYKQQDKIILKFRHGAPAIFVQILVLLFFLVYVWVSLSPFASLMNLNFADYNKKFVASQTQFAYFNQAIYIIYIFFKAISVIPLLGAKS